MQVVVSDFTVRGPVQAKQLGISRDADTTQPFVEYDQDGVSHATSPDNSNRDTEALQAEQFWSAVEPTI